MLAQKESFPNFSSLDTDSHDMLTNGMNLADYIKDGNVKTVVRDISSDTDDTDGFHRELSSQNVAWHTAGLEATESCPSDIEKQHSSSVSSYPPVATTDRWTSDILPRLSADLADQLAVIGVGTGTFVLILFEQSLHLHLAMLSVVKAGGTAIVLDVAQPVDQLSVLASKLPTTITFCLEEHVQLAGKLGHGEITVLSGTDMSLKIINGQLLPQSETERQMRSLWAKVLCIPEDKIRRDDNFFSVGGNGTDALRISRIASGYGLTFSVRDVYNYPLLHSLSEQATTHQLEPGSEIVDAFSLLRLDFISESQALTQAAYLCHVQETQILDILPCTPLQEGLMSLTTKRNGDYVARHVLELRQEVDTIKFRAAWDQVVALNPILRTRIASLPHQGLLQIVLDSGVAWTSHLDLDDYLRKHEGESMALGDPLIRFAILGEPAPGRRFFLWEVHHALYDGWSMPLLMSQAESAYCNAPTASLESIAPFVKYIQSCDKAAAISFWKSQFENLQGKHFPLPTSAGESPRPDQQTVYSKQGIEWNHGHVTAANIVRSAWAVTVAQSTGSNEALFGATVTGRQAPVANIKRMTGPTIATVPIRVVLDWNGSIKQLLTSVQRQAADMIPYEQTGLQHIRRVSEEAALACNFQSLLVVQPAVQYDDSADRLYLGESTDTQEVVASQWQNFSTYPVVAECQLETNGLQLRIGFDSSLISDIKVEALIQRFERALLRFLDGDQGNDRLGTLVANDPDIDTIWTWNEKVPESLEAVVHDLIMRQCRLQPLAPAICAWDGDLSYQQLDELSTALAFKMLSKGVRSGDVVPLLFEKSMWMPVAVLAAMKSGAASVAMDMTQPEDRLTTMVSSLGSPVALSSVGCAAIAHRILSESTNIIPVGSQFSSESTANNMEHHELPTISPTDLLYVVFTSGSTGQPKGVMISHRNFCSAIHHQQKPQGFVPGSRVLDFSSYAFDASWVNSLQTLTAGACLCIPSAVERQNHLAECFEKYRVTLVDLTPSVARFLGPKVLSRLTTLLLGGEAVIPSDATLAGTDSTTEIINVYGPAECTPTVSISPIRGQDISIGRGFGVCTWVVDSENSCQLAPIGAVGELWVEGPLVGDGYINSPEKTAASFVHDPEWLLRGSARVPGRHGILYRTGDLVQYQATSDGTLLFVGRKDTQVKIRGQRLELGEVEHNVLRALSSTSLVNVGIVDMRVTALAIQPKEMGSLYLVAFITLDMGDSTEESHNSAVRSAITGLTDRLSSMVPGYMVPAAFIPLHKIPITPTGKTDRKWLQALGEASWAEYRSTPDQDKSEHPVSDMEIQLQQIWMSVLNLSAEEAPIDKSFVRLGGDSISAMQVVSRARLNNIEFTVTDVLQAATIKKLAPRCQVISRNEVAKTNADQESEDGSVRTSGLSPAQQMFFDAYPDGLNHWNQNFTLKLGKHVPTETFLKALQAVVSRHAMLRARFEQDSNTKLWVQTVAEADAGSFAFDEYFPENLNEVQQVGQSRQTKLDLRKGPVFATDFFNMRDGSQTVILTAHHLVIDLVSWRIVWNDIQEHIEFGKFLSEPPASFQSWCRLQSRVGRNMSPLSVLPFSIPTEELAFWGLPIPENTCGNCEVYTQAFDKGTSSLLFGESNESLGTEALDIILGVLAYSFHQAFPERSVPPIWLEGHGRVQYEDFRLDVSGTVGWFTTVHPIPINITANCTARSAIRLAKDLRRQVPGNGLPYFTCRYLSQSGRDVLKGHDIVEVILNFTGSFQQLESEQGLFKEMDQSSNNSLDLIEVSGTAQRLAMIEISADITDGQLSVSFQVHRRMSHQDRLQEWALAFSQCMQSATQSLLATPRNLTLSDVPLLRGLSHRGLDILQEELLPAMGIKADEVLNIYPCSPLQEGILLSAHKGTASYAAISIFRCLGMGGASSAFDASRLESAWEQVASRHPILSTVFSINPEGQGFVQVVLRAPKPRVSTIITTLASPDSALSKLERPCYELREPQHAFTVCYSTETNELACRLDISHALMDAASISILVQEVLSIFNGLALQTAPGFDQVIRFINERSKAQKIASWATFLDGIECCLFPTSTSSPLSTKQSADSTISIPTELTAPVVEFCKKLAITRAAFLQVVWALVLSHFTSMDDVCFGYLASGRDAPLDGIHSIVGPLSNMLIGRVSLRAPARQVIQTTAKRSIQHLSIQNVSLADIQHNLGLAGKRLFNTTLSIRQGDKLKSENTSLAFELLSGEDSHEFEIGLNASTEGDAFNVSIEFREPDITRNSAQEVFEVLKKAIEHLLSVNTEDTSDMLHVTEEVEPLSSSFFRHVTGADEAALRGFWQLELQNSSEPYSLLGKRATDSSQRDSPMTVNLLLPLPTQCDFPVSVLLKAGWAITEARIRGTTESVFGTAIAQQQHANIVPVRVSLDWGACSTSLLQELHRREVDTAAYARASLQWIRRVSEDAALACEFQTILVISPMSQENEACKENGSRCVPDLGNYALVVECQIVQDAARITMSFDPDVEYEQVTRIRQQFEHVMNQLLDLGRREEKLMHIALDPADLRDIWTWNASVPEPTQDCFHDVFARKAIERPLAPAICAWDGELTYQQLDWLSSTIARSLIQRKRIRVGSIVSLCFEKSMWMPICALAVAKSGAASVATDPASQPEDRLRAITASSDLILCSDSNGSLALQLGNAEVVVIRPEDFPLPENSVGLEQNLEPALPIVEPADRICIQFTSGSTGAPKGVILTHQNICTALAYQNSTLGHHSDSRVFDFASYAFDVCWSNYFNTLAAGGCLCIPSNSERQNDIQESLLKYNVSIVDMTPSIARTVPSSAFANVATLCLGGETVLPSDLLLGGDGTKTIVAYGPAECTPTSTIQDSHSGIVGIGRGVGVCTWVVDAANPGALATVGAVGELWLEGPLVGQGYLGDPEKTSQAFVENPPWLLLGDPASGRPGRSGRLYRTGDLVRYSADGSLLFVGRKDTQVKIRGQRVELAEVEHHVLQAMEPRYAIGAAVVAETFKPKDSNSVCLVAFTCLSIGSNRTDEEHKNAVQEATGQLTNLLAKALPTYMVPSAYIPMQSLPLTPTGKVDRKRLQSIGSSLSVREIGAFNRSHGERRPPTSETECGLQALWAEVLKIAPEDIGLDDSFFRLGGDSIGAMQLVGLARQKGMPLTVGDIFQHPRLFQLAGLDVLSSGA